LLSYLVFFALAFLSATLAVTVVNALQVAFESYYLDPRGMALATVVMSASSVVLFIVGLQSANFKFVQGNPLFGASSGAAWSLATGFDLAMGSLILLAITSVLFSDRWFKTRLEPSAFVTPGLV
jgi:hypothetical protein